MQPDSSFVNSNVSRETLDDLKTYVDLLLSWTDRINLIAPSTISSVWDRHIADCLQLNSLIPPDRTHIADFGAGAGLPGIVLAIVARQSNPARQTILVESDQRKSVFLRRCIQELDLNAEVRTARVETLSPMSVDIVTARGFAPLSKILDLSFPHLAPGGFGIFPKGRNYSDEIAQAQKTWDFHLETHQSISDPEAKILVVKDIQRAG